MQILSQHFAQDDPDLYTGKIKHLLDHGVDNLDDELYFTDEIMLPSGQVKVCIYIGIFISFTVIILTNHLNSIIHCQIFMNCIARELFIKNCPHSLYNNH